MTNHLENYRKNPQAWADCADYLATQLPQEAAILVGAAMYKMITTNDKGQDYDWNNPHAGAR